MVAGVLFLVGFEAALSHLERGHAGIINRHWQCHSSAGLNPTRQAGWLAWLDDKATVEAAVGVGLPCLLSKSTVFLLGVQGIEEIIQQRITLFPGKQLIFWQVNSLSCDQHLLNPQTNCQIGKHLGLCTASSRVTSEILDVLLAG